MRAPTLKLADYEYMALNNPFMHFAFWAGAGAGKTFTGSQWAIKQVKEHPNLTGFIGANTYDQLSQATLRELFFWLDAYGFEWAIDRRPPEEWEPKRRLKSYNNVLSVRYKNQVVTIFTRVLGDPNPLRGIQFSWYWIDETRDTPETTHDVILSRLRESKHIRGFVTSTTNGEDWSYKRFVRGSDGKLYGSMHVPTKVAVDSGLLTKIYYETMLMSYSPLMAAQELDAKHVNVLGGQAYYAASELNRKTAAPWGDARPNLDRPLIVGCDFNFQPAPHIWMIGQVGPFGFHDCIHWFGHLCEVEASTEHMAKMLLMRYPRFFYRIYGDATGNLGTTSNAGITDYNVIARELGEAGVGFTIDVDQHNPLVRDRVENMNARFKNALGEVRQTYDPQGCPEFDADLRVVGWKQTVQRGRGKLDNGGDVRRTHASDASGYAVFKLFPPTRRGSIIPSLPSSVRPDVTLGYDETEIG